MNIFRVLLRFIKREVKTVESIVAPLDRIVSDLHNFADNKIAEEKAALDKATELQARAEAAAASHKQARVAAGNILALFNQSTVKEAA